MGRRRETCAHTNKKEGYTKDNLTGQYYEWECLDCGDRRYEGRTYQHKEICEYAQSLKVVQKRGSIDEALRCLAIVQNMAADAIERMKAKDEEAEKFFKNVF